MYEPPMQKEEYEAAIDELSGTAELDRLGFRFNGAELPDSILRTINNQMFWMSGPRSSGAVGYWFALTLGREHWPRQGSNRLEVTLLERDPHVTPEVSVEQVELEIKYLMGKHFRRGFQDPALGPFDVRMGGPWSERGSDDSAETPCRPVSGQRSAVWYTPSAGFGADRTTYSAFSVPAMCRSAGLVQCTTDRSNPR